MSFRQSWVLLVWVAASACASTQDDVVDRASCEKVRDRVIELRLADSRRFPSVTTLAPRAPSPAQAGPTLRAAAAAHPPPKIVSGPIDLEQHRAAMKQALGESFVGTCESKLTAAQVRCVLEAKDSEGATACYGVVRPKPLPQTASK